MKILTIIDSTIKKISSFIPSDGVALVARLSIFFVFWNSVQTKIAGLTIGGQHFAFWGVTDITITLFEYEYDLPLLSPTVGAYLATFGEFFLSLGLLFGFMTRFSALGLLLMTAVIQVFVFPDKWGVHLIWAAVLLYIAKSGAGAISFDKLLKQA